MFITNRQFIKDFSINTGSTSTPSYTAMCTASEINIETDFETKDFYVFCDALQRTILTGGSFVLSGTIKFDTSNAGEMELLNRVHTFIASGEIAQFNNIEVQYKLLESETDGVLTYKTYKANGSMVLSDMGGAAEDETEFGFEFKQNGVATPVT
jgi:hypothetical protein